MDPIYEIELEDCPICRGIGAIQDEQGWCVYVSYLDCGAQTVHANYNTPEERLAAAQKVAIWPRVQVALGSNLPLPTPVVMPFSTAHFTASA